MKTQIKQPVFFVAMMATALFFTKCGKDDDKPKDIIAPTINITDITVFANENDNNPNDVKFNVSATDNKDANPTTNVTVDGTKVVAESNGEYFVANLQPGNHTVEVESTDKAGNRGTAEATFTIEADKQTPTIKIKDFKITDADNDATGHKNDIECTVEAGDDRKVESLVATIDGKKITADGNTYRAYNLAPGKHTLVVTAIDGAGNKTEVKKEFEIEKLKPVITYNLELEPAQTTPIEEETDGTIATIPFKAEKTTKTGNKTETAPAKNVEATISGADANRLEAKIVNNNIVVSVKAGQGKDHEDADGNDTAEGKAYTGKVTVKILDKDGNVVATKNMNIKVENKDVDDFVLEIDDVKINDKNGSPIKLEEKGKINEDYKVAEEKLDRKEKIAMNDADVENVIEGGKKKFKANVDPNGYGTYPEFIDGEHKGKLVSRAALESLFYAVRATSVKNHPEVSDNQKAIEKTMGMILAQVKEWKVRYINEDLGQTFMEPVNMEKIAGGTASEALKKYRNK